jgi:hypothetical protein
MSQRLTLAGFYDDRVLLVFTTTESRRFLRRPPLTGFYDDLLSQVFMTTAAPCLTLALTAYASCFKVQLTTIHY